MRYPVHIFTDGISIKLWAAVRLGNAASVSCCAIFLHSMDLVVLIRTIINLTMSVRSKLVKMCFV